jgi:site-specific DNA-cytosine methylase
MKCLELFAGIGGFSTAFPHFQLVNAVDIDVSAANVYRSNFAHPYFVKEIASLPVDWFAKQESEVWWLSPPCPPFSRRGRFNDHLDPRSKALLRLIDVVAHVRPHVVCIENVVGFEVSRTFEMLTMKWEQIGYRIDFCKFCPTEIGWINRRPRVYVLASLDSKLRLARSFHPLPKTKLFDILETSPDPSCEDDGGLWLTVKEATQYAGSIDRVNPHDASAIAACFASSYGRSIIHSGSYIIDGGRFRRFTPREVARLLGFPDDFLLPKELDHRTLWRLLGNSVNVYALRAVFGGIFPLADPDE